MDDLSNFFFENDPFYEPCNMGVVRKSPTPKKRLKVINEPPLAAEVQTSRNIC